MGTLLGVHPIVPWNNPVESMALPSYPPKFFTASLPFTPEKLPSNPTQ